jgi:hypothetical protein
LDRSPRQNIFGTITTTAANFTSLSGVRITTDSKVALSRYFPGLWAGTRRINSAQAHRIVSGAETALMATSTGSTSNGTPAGSSYTTALALPGALKKKLHGRAFYNSIGSPKFILAPMVDQSEFVHIPLPFQ